MAFFHFGLFLYPGFGLFPLFDPLPVGQDFLRILHPKDQIASNKDLYLYVSIFTLQGGPHNFTQEIKALYTRFEKSLSIFTMTSIKKHIENFNFRSRIQFDHAAVASYPTSICGAEIEAAKVDDNNKVELRNNKIYFYSEVNRTKNLENGSRAIGNYLV